MNTTLFILLAAGFGGAYAWGMRGYILGGEKGAMLPGAWVGLIIAMAHGADFSLWLPFAIAGLYAMTFGGTEPYGDTLHYIIHDKQERAEALGGLTSGAEYDKINKSFNKRKNHACTGIALKGGLWFGVFASVINLFYCFIAGEISKVFAGVCALLLPVLFICGQLVFNRPYKPDEKKFPRLYFSIDRREEWGGNVFIMIALAAALRGKNILWVIVSFLGGAAGFLGGALIYKLINDRRENKILRYVDGWKVMELTFGGFAGAVSALAAPKLDNLAALNALTDPKLDNLAAYTDAPSPNYLLVFVCFIAILLLKVISLVCSKSGKKITTYVYDLLERPWYSAIPLAIFFFTKNQSTFVAAGIIMLGYVLAEKCVEDFFEKSRFHIPYVVLSVILFAVFIPFALRYNTAPEAALYAFIVLSLAVYIFLGMCRTFDIGRIIDRHKEKKSFLAFYDGQPFVHLSFIVFAVVAVSAVFAVM